MRQVCGESPRPVHVLAHVRRRDLPAKPRACSSAKIADAPKRRSTTMKLRRSSPGRLSQLIESAYVMEKPKMGLEPTTPALRTNPGLSIESVTFGRHGRYERARLQVFCLNRRDFASFRVDYSPETSRWLSFIWPYCKETPCACHPRSLASFSAAMPAAVMAIPLRFVPGGWPTNSTALRRLRMARVVPLL